MGMKWGILSTADINRLVIPPAYESPKVDLVGVASRDQARAEEYARKWEIPRAYGSYEALLADDEIEAVYISLPNNLHCEWSIRAVEAGKHVLCEKPMGKRAAEVEEAFDAAERAGRILSEAFMYRHSPQTERVRQLLDEGAIGELRVVRACFIFGLFDCGTALPSRDELEAIGSEGSLFLDDPWHGRTPVIELRRGGEAERIELEPVDSYRLELENVSDAIRGEAELLLGREDAVGNARAIEALFASAERGEAVSV